MIHVLPTLSSSAFSPQVNWAKGQLHQGVSCLFWLKGSRSQVGCLLCGLPLCCSSGPSQIGWTMLKGRREAETEELVWTCLPEDSGEDAVGGSLAVWGTLRWCVSCLFLYLCCTGSDGVRLTPLSKLVNHCWTLDFNSSPVIKGNNVLSDSDSDS